jgi:hypothetical protein
MRTATSGGNLRGRAAEGARIGARWRYRDVCATRLDGEWRRLTGITASLTERTGPPPCTWGLTRRGATAWTERGVHGGKERGSGEQLSRAETSELGRASKERASQERASQERGEVRCRQSHKNGRSGGGRGHQQGGRKEAGRKSHSSVPELLYGVSLCESVIRWSVSKMCSAPTSSFLE